MHDEVYVKIITLVAKADKLMRDMIENINSQTLPVY